MDHDLVSPSTSDDRATTPTPERIRSATAQTHGKAKQVRWADMDVFEAVTEPLCAAKMSQQAMQSAELYAFQRNRYVGDSRERRRMCLQLDAHLRSPGHELCLSNFATLSQIPGTIEMFTHLTAVNISDNMALSALPGALFQLPRLSSLSIENNPQLAAIEPPITGPSPIETLVLKNLGFDALPHVVFQMPQLKNVALSLARADTVPHAFWQMPQLEEVALCDMPRLVSLGLQSHSHDARHGRPMAPHLLRLRLENCGHTDLGHDLVGVKNFFRLQSLHIALPHVHALPTVVWQHTMLEELTLDAMPRLHMLGLETVHPDECGAYAPKLKTLRFTGCGRRRMPDAIYKLPSLSTDSMHHLQNQDSIYFNAPMPSVQQASVQSGNGGRVMMAPLVSFGHNQELEEVFDMRRLLSAEFQNRFV